MAVKENEQSDLISFVFSHSQTPIFSSSTNNQLAYPRGGKVRLTNKSQFIIQHNEQAI
jgi:ribosomal protein S27E